MNHERDILKTVYLSKVPVKYQKVRAEENILTILTEQVSELDIVIAVDRQVM